MGALARSRPGLPRRPVRAGRRCGRPAGAHPCLPRGCAPTRRGVARGASRHDRDRERPGQRRGDARRQDAGGARRPRGRSVGAADRRTPAAAPRGAGARADGRHRVARRHTRRRLLPRSRLRPESRRGRPAGQHDGARRVRVPRDQRGSRANLPRRRPAAAGAAQSGGTAHVGRPAPRDPRRASDCRPRPGRGAAVVRGGARAEWHPARRADGGDHRGSRNEG